MGIFDVYEKTFTSTLNPLQRKLKLEETINLISIKKFRKQSWKGQA